MQPYASIKLKRNGAKWRNEIKSGNISFHQTVNYNTGNVLKYSHIGGLLLIILWGNVIKNENITGKYIARNTSMVVQAKIKFVS